MTAILLRFLHCHVESYLKHRNIDAYNKSEILTVSRLVLQEVNAGSLSDNLGGNYL